MLYHYNGETFNIKVENNIVKLYHKAINKWSSGWTYIGSFKDQDTAQVAARKYTI